MRLRRMSSVYLGSASILLLEPACYRRLSRRKAAVRLRPLAKAPRGEAVRKIPDRAGRMPALPL